MSRRLAALSLLCLTALCWQVGFASDSPVLIDYAGSGAAPGRSIDVVRPAEATVKAEPSSAKAVASSRANAVKWLIGAQKGDGSWSSRTHHGNPADASDVATTALSVLALFRDANGTERHRAEITKGTLFVVKAVETAPTGPKLNTPQGTQIQGKLGQLVDTHMAALMLGEIAGKLDKETDRRVQNTLDKVLSKVQQAQKADGSFDNNGWAPVLSSSIAAQSLYKAAELGRDVDAEVLAKADKYQSASLGADGRVDARDGAGVPLYAVATTLAGSAKAAKRDGASAGDARKNELAAAQTGRMVSADSGALMAGYGSIGGEEMLSYMMISDTLAAMGGDEWTAWEGKVGGFLVGTQNADGSWAGHHCITSPVFVTAGAVMTLAAGDFASQSHKG
jgi:hypothetical protein